MPSYIGKHASLYDLFYSDKDYKVESDFIHQLILETNGSESSELLELACGTGNHAFCLEKKGYSILATDNSDGMIDQAKIKAKERSSNVQFEMIDMRDIGDIPRKFDVILCLFDSIGYLITNDNIKTVFKNVYDKLNEGGIFIVEFWHAAAMLKGYDPIRIKRWKFENSEILRISETSIDIRSQSCDVRYSIYQTNKDGTYSFLEETQKNRFFLLQEMNSMLEDCHFKIVNNFAGYNKEKTINENTWHILTVAQKISI
jgi:SAM-dependent methyltransferase